MRRALRASRLVAFVVAQFLYLAFEEAVRARGERHEAAAPKAVPTVHEMPTLPGSVPAPFWDLEAPRPVIRILESKTEVADVEAPRDVLPASLADLSDLAETEASGSRLDVATLLDTLRRDVGCTRAPSKRSHLACRAAETLAAVVDRDAVLVALEETVTAAGRPMCVRIAATGALRGASGSGARRALLRMLAVARGRAAWGGAPSDHDLVSLLLHALDA